MYIGSVYVLVDILHFFSPFGFLCYIFTQLEAEEICQAFLHVLYIFFCLSALE